MQYGKTQAEMIYLSLLQTLREYNIPYDEKHDLVTGEIDTRHEAVDLLDLLDGLQDFIVKENEFVFDEEE